MNNYMRNRRSRLGPRPGEFPLGSAESRAAARAVLLAFDIEAQEQQAAFFRNLTPLEQEFAGLSEEFEVQKQLVRIVRETIIPRHEYYGTWLPTVEEARHNRQVAEEIGKIRKERAALGDTAFLDVMALREMAEDRLRHGSRGRAQTGSMTAEVAAKKK
jgi:hypothetical protein